LANPGAHGIFDFSEAGGLEFRMTDGEEDLTAKAAKSAKTWTELEAKTKELDRRQPRWERIET
jgi:hypothetical protein